MTDTTHDPPPDPGGVAIAFELRITATGEVRNADGELLAEVNVDDAQRMEFRDAAGNELGLPTDRGTLLVTAAELDTIAAIIAGAEPRKDTP